PAGSGPPPSGTPPAWSRRRRRRSRWRRRGPTTGRRTETRVTEPAERVGADALTREGPEDAVLEYPGVGIKRRFLTERGGSQLTRYAGLVDALHAQSAGRFELTTAIAQLPSEANGMTAVVTARAAISDGANRDLCLRVATRIGDASPRSVDRR